MELYSSALWHLKREVDLSVLAHHLHSSHKLRPQAMCAMASLKNLYKDHEAAVSQLNRAITVSVQGQILQ
jgi:anaphase-promoting complex subunit 3